MNKVFIFVLGAAAGSLVTWKILEEKYNQIIKEEIEAVEKYYREKEEKLNNKLKMSEELTDALEHDILKSKEQLVEEKKIKEDYKKEIEDLGYTVETEQLEEYIIPYVISPDEFGEAFGYDTKSWTFYADGVLTDEIGAIVADPDFIIGDALEHFGEYEDDSVFVRNDNTECDYEILKHEKAFSEINGEEN